MPFLVSLISVLASVLMWDELTCAIAFASAAMRTLTTARRGGKEFQKGRKAAFDRIVELFHGGSIAWGGPAAKGKSRLASICNTQESGARL